MSRPTRCLTAIDPNHKPPRPHREYPNPGPRSSVPGRSPVPGRPSPVTRRRFPVTRVKEPTRVGWADHETEEGAPSRGEGVVERGRPGGGGAGVSALPGGDHLGEPGVERNGDLDLRAG